MFKMKIITLSLLAFLLVMSFASCASDTTSDSPMPNKDMKAYLQVRVTVDGSGDTRASRADKEPQGGEDGNGREPGINHENDVNSLTVLLYKSDKDKKDLSEADATIDYVYTFTNLNKVTTSSGSDATYTTVPKEIDAAIVGKNYHVIVIANADDMTSRWCKGKKISEVRDLQMLKVCTRDADITKFSNFIMSSKEDAKIDFTTNKGSETDPYQVEVDIERLAARIDIIPNATYDGTGKGYYYNVMDGTNVVGGFKLESVTPTKVMTKGEYLIKRVSPNAVVSAVTYFGLETKDAANKATNYVVCPWTKDRTGLTLSNAEGPISLYNVKMTTSTSTTVGEASYILDYVMENTTTDNKEDYSTGLIFKGKYYESSEWDATKHRPIASATGTNKEYTYTIRHSDPTGAGPKTAPMYYGIVRNNIYRVRIEGVVGKSKGLTLTIHVVPWAHYDHGEVIY